MYDDAEFEELRQRQVAELRDAWITVGGRCVEVAETMQPHGLIADTNAKIYQLGDDLRRLGDALTELQNPWYDPETER